MLRDIKRRLFRFWFKHWRYSAGYGGLGYASGVSERRSIGGMYSSTLTAPTEEKTRGLIDLAISESNDACNVSLRPAILLLIHNNGYTYRIFIPNTPTVPLVDFCEHVCFLGSVKYPGENKYKSYLVQHGGHLNASTSMHFTTYKFDALDGDCKYWRIWESKSLFHEI